MWFSAVCVFSFSAFFFTKKQHTLPAPRPTAREKKKQSRSRRAHIQASRTFLPFLSPFRRPGSGGAQLGRLPINIMGNFFCESCLSKSSSSSSGGYEALADGAVSGSASNATASGPSSNGAHKHVPIVNEIVAVQAPPDLASSYQPSGAGSNGARSTAFASKYEQKEEIGVGSTSKCYRCLRKSDGQSFACKVIDKKQVEMKFSGLLDQFFIEIKVLKMLNHPNIIKLEDMYETSDKIYMVMERMLGGELFDYVVEKGTLSEQEASTIVRKVTSAVAHMHSMDIIHRDLKPENLLLTSKRPDAEVKLIDFGLAKVTPDNLARSFLGTRGYLAPEMLQRHSYDKAVDIWALGVIVFVLLCGCLPFDDDSSRIANETAARKKFTLRFPRWASNLSVSAKDLLHNLLDVDPKVCVSLSGPLPDAYLTPSYLLGIFRRGTQRTKRSTTHGCQGARCNPTCTCSRPA